MPETNTYEIKAKDVRKGDVIDLGTNGVSDPIVEKDVKTKYVYITVEEPAGNGGRQQLKLEGDADIVVNRTEPTADEKAAESRKFYNEWYCSTAQKAIETLHSEQERLAEAALNQDRIDYSDMAAIAETQEAARLWNGVKRHVSLEIDWVAAYEIVKEQCTEELLSDYMRGNSTNAYSNAIEGTKRAVYSKFVRGILF